MGPSVGLGVGGVVSPGDDDALCDLVDYLAMDCVDVYLPPGKVDPISPILMFANLMLALG